jgi:hypothetical protein
MNRHTITQSQMNRHTITQTINNITRHTHQLPKIATLIQANPDTPTYGTQTPTGASHTTNTNPWTPTERAALNPTPQAQAITSITSDLQIIQAAHQRIHQNAQRLQYATTQTTTTPKTDPLCEACNHPANPPRSARSKGPFCPACAESWRTAPLNRTYNEWLNTRKERTTR